MSSSTVLLEKGDDGDEEADGDESDEQCEDVDVDDDDEDDDEEEEEEVSDGDSKISSNCDFSGFLRDDEWRCFVPSRRRPSAMCGDEVTVERRVDGDGESTKSVSVSPTTVRPSVSKNLKQMTSLTSECSSASELCNSSEIRMTPPASMTTSMSSCVTSSMTSTCSRAQSSSVVSRAKEHLIAKNVRQHQQFLAAASKARTQQERAVRSVVNQREVNTRRLVVVRQQQQKLALSGPKLAEMEAVKAEAKSLREERDQLTKELALLRIQGKELQAAISRMRQQHTREMKLLLDGAKRQNVKENRELIQLQRALQDKQKEIREKEKMIYKLECEKMYLGEEIFRLTGVEEGFWNDETPPKSCVTERERSLIRRNSTLGTQITLLERQCGSLKIENESLKRRMELEREKERPVMAKERQKEVQVLRKKNLELTTMTRKLEEKVKNLEKKTKEAPPVQIERGPKSNLASRQREREAEGQRQMMARDREILALKERLRDVSRRLATKEKPLRSAKEKGAQELESIIVQAAKERMQLERHLAIATENLQRTSDVDIQKYLALEETNRHLRLQLEELDRITQQHKIIQLQLEEKNEQCVDLSQKLKAKTELCEDLENQLVRVIEKNTELTIQNSDLQRQIQELQRLSEECDSLRRSLSTSETECESAQEEVGVLRTKISNLESVLQQMREAAERRKELEKEHTETLAQLQEKRDEISRLTKASDAERQSNLTAVEQLQARIKELERKTEQQNVRHEELLRDMAAAKRAAKEQQTRREPVENGTPKSSEKPLEIVGLDRSKDVSVCNGVHNGSDKSSSNPNNRPHVSQVSPDSGTVSPDGPRMQLLNESASLGSTLAHHHRNPHHLQNGVEQPPSSSRVGFQKNSSNDLCNGMDPSALAASGYIETRMSNSGLAGLGVADGLGYGLGPGPRCCPTVGLGQSPGSLLGIGSGGGGGLSMSKPGLGLGLLTPSSALSSLLTTTTTTTTSSTSTLPSTPGLTDLTNALGGVSLLGSVPNPGATSVLPATGITLTPSGTVGVNLVPASSSASSVPSSSLTAGPSLFGAEFGASPYVGSGNVSFLNVPPGIRLPLQGTSTAASLTSGSLLTTGPTPLGQQVLQAQAQAQQTLGSPVIDMLDIPGKGKCYVYIARYSYDPFLHSPNDNPESELPLTAGDYILVWGNMDEDGFFDGELLDGRRGSVPSNFVEKLVGDDLLDFHQAVVLGLRPDSREEEYSTSIPHDLDYVTGPAPPGPEEVPYYDYHSRRLMDYSYLDLEDILEEEEEEYVSRRPGEGPVPAPKQLTLERQLNKSVLIGWNAPDCPPGTIESYHVYVDGNLKTTVRANERTRALVEDVDSLRPHRISVRSVTPNRRTSRDAACTMLIGKHVPLAPTYVRASNVTSTSAIISWLPSNSNFQHVVCVNNVEVRTVKPGVYRHTISGLTPNTVYRVTVRAKNIKAPHFDEKSTKHLDKLSAHTEFRTLPKGLPDPPVDIQVENGPQDGTLLVTWLPVTINNAGTSNGAPVTGYAVYADGKKVCDVDSPTGDHALIDLNKIPGFLPRQVTVRTKSRDGQSGDSIPGVIPTNGRRANKQPCPESLGDLTERSELSDIAEEPEEYLSSPSASSVEEGMDRNSRQVPNVHQGGHYPGQMGQQSRMMNKRMDPRRGHMEDDMRNDLPSHMNIPSIEITKDSTSDQRSMDWNCSDEESRNRYDLSDAENDARMRMQRNPVQRRNVNQRRGVGPAGGYYGRKGPGDAHNQGYPGGRNPDQPRLFIATYDYDPTTQSPNMDNSAELPFNQGDLIKVYGDKDPDGFYFGEVNDRRGLIPGNMVKEVQIDDVQIAREMMSDGSRGRAKGDYQQQHHPGDRSGDIYEEMPVRRMVAAYDYDPQQSSPNVDSDAELAFRCGDVIKVYGDMDDDGFFLGELNGRRGLVPSNFLVDDQAVDQEYYNVRDQQQQGRNMGQMNSMRPSGPGAHGPPPPPRDRDARRRGAAGDGANGRDDRMGSKQNW